VVNTTNQHQPKQKLEFATFGFKTKGENCAPGQPGADETSTLEGDTWFPSNNRNCKSYCLRNQLRFINDGSGGGNQYSFADNSTELRLIENLWG
jgi:hypothetical protein